jgi:hypothetical protein
MRSVRNVSVTKPSTGYQADRYFTPADPAEHDAADEGRDYKGVPSYDLRDYCNCGAAFHSPSVLFRCTSDKRSLLQSSVTCVEASRLRAI